jgi:hypothetical protein
MQTDMNGIQSIVSGSSNIVSWSMSLFGASLLAILSTSYVKPIGKWSKLIYLCYIPAWIYLAYSMKGGDTIARRGIMASINPNRIPEILEKMNDEYAQQLSDFNSALIFFGLWLVLYLFWWLLQDFFIKANKS